MSSRISLNRDGTLDDGVFDAVSVHVEDLGNGIWIAIYREDGERYVLMAQGKGRGTTLCRITENPGCGTAAVSAQELLEFLLNNTFLGFGIEGRAFWEPRSPKAAQQILEAASECVKKNRSEGGTK